MPHVGAEIWPEPKLLWELYFDSVNRVGCASTHHAGIVCDVCGLLVRWTSSQGTFPDVSYISYLFWIVLLYNWSCRSGAEFLPCWKQPLHCWNGAGRKKHEMLMWCATVVEHVELLSEVVLQHVLPQQRWLAACLYFLFIEAGRVTLDFRLAAKRFWANMCNIIMCKRRKLQLPA